MNKFDLVISNGTVITSTHIAGMDLGIRDGKIAAWGENLDGAEKIDATDLLVIPGGVDPHVHLQMPTATTITSDDWHSGSRAALFGGTTTVIDFVEPAGGETLQQALDKRNNEAAGSSWVDYGLHMTISTDDADTLNQIPAMLEQGVTSFKSYTTYDGLKLGYGQIKSVMERVAAVGGVLMVHAEDDRIIKNAQEKLLLNHQITPQWFPFSRPEAAEIEAVQICLDMAKETGVNLYLVHLSTSQAIQLVECARLESAAVLAETCPQYLLLNLDGFQEGGSLSAAGLICSPPIRGAYQNQFIWEKLANDHIQTIGSDHCAFRLVPQKSMGLQDFRMVPGGLPGIELRYSLLHTYGVQNRVISLSKWVDLCSARPARAFGLYPRKGSLAVGADADVVLFDPRYKLTVSWEMLHENVDYSPYEGFELQGYPVRVIKAGKTVVQNNQLKASQAGGKFLRCGLPQFVD